MDKLTKTKIEELANEIVNFLDKNGLSSDTSIYFNDKVIRHEYKWKDDSASWTTTENVNPHDYFDYCAYEHILSMSFEGPLYDVLHYTFGKKEEEFLAIFEKYGVYYELGNAWNLSCYLINDNTEVEYTHYDKPKKTIYLYSGNFLNPRELQHIMDVWYDLSEKEGDKGSCVLGAGFEFEYQGDKYFMPAQSPYQGSISWETHKDTIYQMLEDIGTTDIWYNWGRMD